MSEQELFEYLKKNLVLRVEGDSREFLGDITPVVRVKLLLKNPATGEDEVVAEGYDSI